MKRILFSLLALAFLVSACASKAATTPKAQVLTLKVSMGTVDKTYTMADLQALGAVQETFKGVTYTGMPLTTLLTNAGFAPTSLTAVKAVASDGYSVNYSPALFNLPDTMLAYARSDGPLSDTEAPFVLVLPNQEGKLNARMVVQIIALP